MTVSLDRDAELYLQSRRLESAMSAAEGLDPRSLRLEERSLRSRYGHGPEMWHESLVEARHDAPRHYILEPTEHVLGEIVYLHGGGWVMGEPEDYLPVCRALADASGWRIIVADYRKAPEHPFPAAYSDALAMVHHRLEHGADRWRDGEGIPFGVAGDSSGGNLAAAISASLAANQPHPLSVQVLIYPVLDSDLNTASYLDPDRQLSLTREVMSWFWDQYAPRSVRDDVRAAPLKSDRLHGLPETVFLSVESDVLHSEGEAYLDRLRQEGVAVHHREFSGQLHGFFQLYNVMAASTQAVAWIAQELRALSARRKGTTLTQSGAVN